jgi:hypothetical protein
VSEWDLNVSSRQRRRCSNHVPQCDSPLITTKIRAASVYKKKTERSSRGGAVTCTQMVSGIRKGRHSLAVDGRERLRCGRQGEHLLAVDGRERLRCGREKQVSDDHVKGKLVGGTNVDTHGHQRRQHHGDQRLRHRKRMGWRGVVNELAS